MRYTYPAAYPTEPKDYKAHLDRFFKRVEREYPGAFSVWKLEFQERGSPHFHIIVMGVACVDSAWLSRAWYECVGSGDEKHLRAGTSVELVNKWKGIRRYTAKMYLAKTFEALSGTGRRWGVRNREGYDRHVDVEEVEIDADHYYRVRQVLARFVRKGVRGYSLRWAGRDTGLWCFIDSEIFEELLAQDIWPPWLNVKGSIRDGGIVRGTT